MVVRDRNRLALQSDLVGAAALGIRNVLCLSGDHQRFGNHPTSKGVYDIDSIQFLQMVRTMRDEHQFINGEEFTGDTPFFIGAAANPFADPFEFRVTRLVKKINAGADFIQTQGIFDVPKFVEWMRMVADKGLHERTHILAGLIPMKSVGMARYMANNVSGLSLPKELVDRMADAKDPKEEGVRICLETIEQLKEVEGIAGIHIMAVAWEDIVPRIVEEAGLMPRPTV
jgi:methylenetetrahydrofolate reductase (NADPH)